MSEKTPPRRVLHLLAGHPSPNLIREVAGLSTADDVSEVFQLTEDNAREALEKIFAADTVAVWGEL